jgi:hypothetical protein
MNPLCATNKKIIKRSIENLFKENCKELLKNPKVYNWGRCMMLVN